MGILPMQKYAVRAKMTLKRMDRSPVLHDYPAFARHGRASAE